MLNKHSELLALEPRIVFANPAGANHTVTTPEDIPYALHLTDFGFTDSNPAPNNSFAAVSVTTLPTVGTLTDQGNAVTAGQVIPVADITSGLLQYTPPTSTTSQSSSDSFTFQVQDSGSNIDPTPRTMTETVTALTVYNVVTDYGADDTGATDSTVAIRDAITAAEVDGGIVYIPTGTYEVSPQAGDPSSQYNTEFNITGSNVVIIGDGPNSTILESYAMGDQNPITTLNPNNSRETMFYINSEGKGASGVQNIVFSGFTADGQTGWDGDYAVSYDDATNPDGWDITNKAFLMDGNGFINNISYTNVTVDKCK